VPARRGTVHPAQEELAVRARSAAIGTLLFAVTVPVTVAAVVPRWLARDQRGGQRGSAPWRRVLGGAAIGGGVALVGDAFVRFARARGTPAPVAETEHLVVTGPYRWSRNPQYVGVVAIAAGQGVRWGSPPVLLYTIGLALGFDGWVRWYEEPRLRRLHGDEYRRYVARVPRWFGPSQARP
jgi:protein-S-isoprenylcysteine O-methyltransferase Ste14